MAFTYGGDPSNSKLDAVRLAINDTDSSNASFQDEEINYFLEEENDNVYGAAALACETLSTRYADKVDVNLQNSISKSYSELSKKYTEQAKELRKKARKSSIVRAPYFSSNGEKKFTIGQFDNNN